MPRQPKFRVFNTADGWCVNVPASLSESGKRERHFHKTRDKAQEHATQLRDKFEKHGKAAMIIKPSLAEAARGAAIGLAVQRESSLQQDSEHLVIAEVDRTPDQVHSIVLVRAGFERSEEAGLS